MTHAWHDVTPGERLPQQFTVVVEIPTGSSIKYELDKQTGLLRMDHKILAVAIDDPEYSGFSESSELPGHRLHMLRRFFQDYKTLEGKTVEVEQFQSSSTAVPIIEAALERYSEQRRRGFRKK